jgi:heme-degrading monooxygenase HmoA
MYVRFLTFKANPRRRSEVEALGDQVFKYVKSLKGFISVHFIISENSNEYGSFSLWESRADAIAAGQSIRAKTGGTLQNLASGSPKTEIYEVYKPGI